MKPTLFFLLIATTVLTLASCAERTEVPAGAEEPDSDRPTIGVITSDDPARPANRPGSTWPSPEEKAAGFRLLFDGQTFNGWHGYGGKNVQDKWRVRNGAIEFRKAGEGSVDLVTDEVFENFELRLEWKISQAGNSGIMFNVAETPEYSTPWRTGPELQILDNDGHADGASFKHRAGDLYDLVSASHEASRPVGEWNESRIHVEDGLLRHWLNGVRVIEVQMWDEAWDELVAGSKFATMPGFGRYRGGRIALQDHGDEVAFRNIRIREL